jgi:hypothetical protein
MKRQIVSVAIIAVLLFSALLVFIPPVASDGEGGGGRGMKILMWHDCPSSSNIGWVDYQTAIVAYGASFTRTRSQPSLSYMQQFDLVIYYTGGILGSGWPSASDADRMKAYLDSGGNILWSGHFPAWCASMAGRTTFIRSYFGVYQRSYHYFNYNNHYMIGTNGNLEITGNWMVYYNHPEIYSNYYFHEYWSVTGNGVREMYCQSYSSYATMISVDTSTYKTVCMAFDLNLINSASIQLNLMTKILDFFGGSIVADVEFNPQALNLESNGNWIQFKVYGFPENPEYAHTDVDPTTCYVLGVGADLKFATYSDDAYIGKADRLLVEDAIGSPGAAVEIEVGGSLKDGTDFIGLTTIKAIKNQ